MSQRSLHTDGSKFVQQASVYRQRFAVLLLKVAMLVACTANWYVTGMGVYRNALVQPTLLKRRSAEDDIGNQVQSIRLSAADCSFFPPGCLDYVESDEVVLALYTVPKWLNILYKVRMLRI